MKIREGIARAYGAEFAYLLGYLESESQGSHRGVPKTALEIERDTGLSTFKQKRMIDLMEHIGVLRVEYAPRKETFAKVRLFKAFFMAIESLESRIDKKTGEVMRLK